MAFSPLLQELLDALRCLPGVGQRSAQRMAFHLLERDREGAARLVGAIGNAIEGLGHCSRCRMFAEEELCDICSNASRDHSTVCVVESPADVVAVEESGGYRGRYFVLMGRLSPLDGIGPDELGLDSLESQLDEVGISEIIIATSATVEGEATAAYLASLGQARDIAVTRIAQGVPIGGELEYVDGSTLSRAISARRQMDAI